MNPRVFGLVIPTLIGLFCFYLMRPAVKVCFALFTAATVFHLMHLYDRANDADFLLSCLIYGAIWPIVLVSGAIYSLVKAD